MESMEISRYSSKFVLMQDVARKILNKCSGCMLAVSIFGSILSNTPKNESAWKKVYAQFKYYASVEEYTPYDYNGTIFAAIDLSLEHDENKMFSKDLMWNVLQALSLFPTWDIPSRLVKLAWKSMQPEGKTENFEAVVNSLIHKNLVDGSAYGYLRLHDLVLEYLELKKPIDVVTILCDQEGELKQGRELLAIFLSIYGKQCVHAKMLLWQTSAMFDEITIDDKLHDLLDTDAENAILAVYQLYKATRQDAKALLYLMHNDGLQALTAAEVLIFLTINAGAKNLLVGGDIEIFVHLCTHNLPNIPDFSSHMYLWCSLMLKMANCNVFAKKMICHKPLLIFIVERMEKHDCYLLEFVQILMALILYVQEIGNISLEENVLQEDKDVMRKSMKSCVLDNTCLSHVVLYHGENSSRGTKVPCFEPKFIFEHVKWLLQQYVRKAKMNKRLSVGLSASMPPCFLESLHNFVDITNGATHFVEYGCVELLFYLEDPTRNGMTFEHSMKFFCHKVIFESISSDGHINSLVSILKHGTKDDVMNVPWILKYLAIGHEEVALQLITEVGVEKMLEAIELWEYSWKSVIVELWLKHEGIVMIMQGIICQLLTRFIHQNSLVCMHVLSNLIRYHGDIVVEDLDAKGGLRLLLACYNMQPFNRRWIQLLQDMAQNKAFANKMAALGIIEMLGDTLNHLMPFCDLISVAANKMVALGIIEMLGDTPNHSMSFWDLISVAGLVRCLVEGFEDRLEILLSKICIKDLLAIHEQLSLQGILEFTFLPGAFVIIKKIAMDLLASYHHERDLFAHDRYFYVLVNLAKSHEEIASLIANAIATNDEMMKKLDHNLCVPLLSTKFAMSREKKVKGRQI